MFLGTEPVNQGFEIYDGILEFERIHAGLVAVIILNKLCPGRRIFQDKLKAAGGVAFRGEKFEAAGD